MRESVLVSNLIRGLYGVVHLMRANVGSVRTADGRRFSTGLPKGFPDLFGILPPWESKSGAPVPVFLEAKVRPNRPTDEQVAFLDHYKRMGCICGVVYSVDEAWALLIPYLKPRYYDDTGALIYTGEEGEQDDGKKENVRPGDC